MNHKIEVRIAMLSLSIGLDPAEALEMKAIRWIGIARLARAKAAS